MAHPSIQYISSLTPQETELLTQLLSISPNSLITSEWLSDQSTLISSFPTSLTRPTDLLPRLTLHLPFTPQKAHLCKPHKPLNPYLIRRLFLQVSAEVTTRVARLEEHPCLPQSLADFLKKIHSVNSLWMAPELYRAAFTTTPSDARFSRILGGCEACILAVIGGNHGILSVLRASMLGRRKKQGPIARLLKIVDAWIDWTGRGEEIREESGELGKEIRECRRQMQHARRQKKRNLRDGVVIEEDDTEPLLVSSTDAVHTPTENEGGEDADDHDFEGSIINEYFRRWSRCNFVVEEGAIHPAFRDSVRGDGVPVSPLMTEEMVSRRAGSQCTNWPRVGRAQTEVDSVRIYNDVSQNMVGAAGLRSVSSEEQAKAYRDLVGIPNGEGCLGGK